MKTYYIKLMDGKSKNHCQNRAVVSHELQLIRPSKPPVFFKTVNFLTEVFIGQYHHH